MGCTHKGPKTFTNYQRVALIILYHRSRKALRDFIAELYETLWPKWLGLKEIPGKSTLNDWMKLFKLDTIKNIHNLLVSKQKPEIMTIIARIIFASLLIPKKRSKTLTLKLRKLMNYAKCEMKSITED